MRFDKRYHWKTRDGSVVRIRDMADSHLANAIRLLEHVADQNRGQAIRDGYAALSCLQGEMAQFYAERELDVLVSGADDCDDEDFDHPSLEYLRREVARRERKQEGKRDANG